MFEIQLNTFFSSNLLYLGTDKEYVRTKGSLPQPEVSFNNFMSLGGKDVESKGFVGNIRQVYCSEM